jgi:glyoxylase-like metal-dependent hydrolase (beta-lactamase superfamily II)
MKFRVAITVLVALIVAAGALFLSFFLYMSSAIHPVETRRITPGIVALKNSFVNAFIVQDGTNAIAIDAGISEKDLLRELGKAGIPPAAVSHVFFTHSDGDHTGGAKAFSSAVFLLSDEEAKLARHEVKRKIFGMEMYNTMPVPYKTFHDGQTWKIGNIRVEAILTPGHTPGSTSFLVNGTDLFTGDLMILNRGKADITRKLLNNDSAQSSNSIRMLANRGVNYARIMTAHSGVTFDAKGAFSGFRN